MTSSTTEIKETLALFADDINNINDKIEKLDIKINGRLHDKGIFDLIHNLSTEVLELDYTVANTNIVINKLTKQVNDLKQKIKGCNNDR